MNNIIEKIDWKLLNEYIENDLIIANKHPKYDIWVLNYSPKAQFKQIWDTYTISCRGMVIDAEGNILCRCMTKFKNIEEHNPSDIDMSLEYEIFVKMDGSLIHLFWYEAEDTWIISSRGSFISEQAIESKKMLDNKNNIYNHLNKNYTYIFEILYPENRVVIEYGNTYDLILLTVIETKTGYELSYSDINNSYSQYFTIVEKINVDNLKDLRDLKKLEEDNKEGFVVRFKKDNFRIKIKFDGYVRLHSVLTNVSNITVWEHLMNNYDFNEIYEIIPDEFRQWLDNTIFKLRSAYNEIERLALKEFLRIYHVNNIISRKEFAVEAHKTKYQSILFKMYNKKSYEFIIWKLIKPEYSKPFRDGYYS